MNKGLIFAVAVAVVVGGFFYISEKKPEDKPIIKKEPVFEERVLPFPVIPPVKEIEEAPVVEVEDDVEIPAVENIELGAEPELGKQFEQILNSLLAEVQEVFNVYRKERKVISDLVKEENLRDPKYVEENAVLMTEVTAKLRKKADEVLAIFEKADTDIQEILAGVSEESRQELTEKWDALVQENIGAYQNFFRNEEKAAKAHASLMRFYYKKRNAYSFDEKTKKIVFVKSSDQEFARKLRVQVNRMSRTQNMILPQK